MLERLRVDNLALFERAELTLQPKPSLIAITGETGAGKTVLTQAVRLISGEGADAGLIGPFAGEAYAEAEFACPPPAVVAELADEDADHITLARRLRASGSRALVCGRAASAGQLQDAAADLICLTGQHAARRLVDAAFQRDLLDRFAGLDELRERVRDAYRAWRTAERQLQQLRERVADNARRERQLRNDIEFVEQLNPTPGEEEQLEAERNRLRYAEQLAVAAHAAAELLNGDDETTAVSTVGRAAAELDRGSEHDHRLAELAADAHAICDQLTELARSARELTDSYDSDPRRLAEIEQRLSDLRDLRRRFAGADIATILDQVQRDRALLEELDAGAQLLEEKQRAAEHAAAAYHHAAQQLSGKRKASASKLARATEAHLADLGLAEAKLHITVEPAGKPSAHGLDRVSFALAANAGMRPAPLDRGASGGELSRVNLALLLASGRNTGTLIFDEVDAGIGGEVAHRLARKLRELAQTCQVIVITHLAQIAVQADRHYFISKDTRGGVTRATVELLDSEQRRSAEIARLVGADSADADAARAARELVTQGART
jgi:DNA repair protein RecN (Recombination protein N)